MIGFLRRCWRIVSYVLLYTVIQYSVMFVVMLAVRLSVGERTWEDKNSFSHFLIIILPILITFLIMRRRFRGEWKESGFWRRDNITFSVIMISAGIGLSASLAVSGLFGSFLSLLSAGEPERFLMDIPYGNSVPAIITYDLFMPFIEEIIFRGTVLKRIRQTNMAVPAALIIQALLFGAAHTGIVQITYAFFVGIIYGVIYLRTGSIWTAIAAHIAFNSVSDLFVVIYNMSGGVPDIVWLLFSVVCVVSLIVLMKIQKKRQPDFIK